MRITRRLKRHVRITRKAYTGHPTPPFLILFVNSTCNMQCAHCFYWRSLNQKDDLSLEEMLELSRSLGRVENLNLSGGEPFIRKDLGKVCRQFIRHNGVREIYVPTNGYFRDRTIAAVSEILSEPDLEILAIELSLDGMPAYHDEFRGTKNAFRKAMETYDALAELQSADPRLRIHATSTATERNMEEIRRLTSYLYERCPQMDHHNLAIIRGDRKDPSLQGPALAQYEELYDYIQRQWAPREEGRYGSIVEPMLQWAKVRTIREGRQVVPCKAGWLSGVVYANGDVSLCETHAPVGNLRDSSFQDIWFSPAAAALRARIAARDCYCTTEVFMWPSIVHQPVQLARAMRAAHPWRRPLPLAPVERLSVRIGPDGMPLDPNGGGATTEP